jgi:beta-N-acetylhexosaminidase
MLLVCNAPDAVGELLDHWRPVPDPVRAARIARLLPTSVSPAKRQLIADIRYQAGQAAVRQLAG